MRALISLSHRAGHTRKPIAENDEAFVQSGPLALSSGREESMVSVSDGMKNYISLIHNAP
jgi:hypothetical protein